VSQNICALLGPLEAAYNNRGNSVDGMFSDRSSNGNGSRSAGVANSPSFDILDVCSGSGRDLVSFTKLGHRAVGLDGVAAFCEMSRKLSGCEVWELNMVKSIRASIVILVIV
jgi:hypothetical protein